MEEGCWRGCSVGEGGGVEDAGDMVPFAVYGHQDGADEVLVEFDGKNGVEFGGVAEGNEVETDGVREGNVAAGEVLAGSANGGERSGTEAVVRGLHLDGERLRSRNAGVGGGELHRTETSEDGVRNDDLRYDNRLGWGCRGWGRPKVVTLGRSYSQGAAEQDERAYESERTDGGRSRLHGENYTRSM